MQRQEISAEWITRELDAVFRAYPKEEVERALPLLVLVAGRDFGVENLDPRLQAEVERVLVKAGVREGGSVEETQAKIAKFIEGLDVSEALLRDVKSVFDTHYGALTEQSA